MIGNVNAEIGYKNKPYGNGKDKFGLELKKERGDTLVEWAISRKYKIMNTMLQKKESRRWTWKSPNGETKDEIDNLLRNSLEIVTDVTVIKQVIIVSDHDWL